MGPLRVAPENPRYFSDLSGRAVYLTGAHTWNNFIDMGTQSPPQPFNYEAYLDFLQAHNHNFIRLWAWDVPRPDDALLTPRMKVTAPQPWLRTGPGTDVTGLPKFDLTKLSPGYFQRLRARVEAARDRGLYVSVMLFDGWSVQFSPGKNSHPFLGPNNINETAYLTDVRDIHTLRHPQITQWQKNYVRAVLDAVADLDNVLFEIANEAGSYSTDWQNMMIGFLKCYESGGPMQHPAGMTYQHRGGSNSTLFASDADWIAPGGQSGNYRSRPEVATGVKVVVADTDHLHGSSLDDPLWVYRSFFQGLNTLYMDRYVEPDALNVDPVPAAPQIRAALGHVRLIATVFDIGSMVPAPDFATTGYALRGSGGVLVFAPDDNRFDIDLRAFPGENRLQWLDTVTGRVTDGGTVSGGSIGLIRSPLPRAAVLFLRAAASSGPSLTDLEEEARAIRQASLRYARWPIRMQLIAKAYLDEVRGGYRALMRSLFAAALTGLGIGFAAGWILHSRRARS